MNNKSSITLCVLFVSVLALATLAGCKTEDSTPNADKVAGTYLVKDTMFITANSSACYGGNTHFEVTNHSIVLTKQTNNTVSISGFYNCGLIVATVSTSRVEVTNNPSNCPAMSDFLGAISGDNIYFSYTVTDNPACTYRGSATATKQP